MLRLPPVKQYMRIYQNPKSHNAPVPYQTMHYSEVIDWLIIFIFVISDKVQLKHDSIKCIKHVVKRLYVHKW